MIWLLTIIDTIIIMPETPFTLQATALNIANKEEKSDHA
jgi:hypothetical protein